MARSVFVGESRGEQWRMPKLAADWPDRVRLAPTIAAVLDDLRPVTLDRGDQLVEDAVKAAIARLIFDGRFEEAQRHLGTITRASVPDGPCARCVAGPVPSGTGVTNGDRKPLTAARAR